MKYHSLETVECICGSHWQPEGRRHERDGVCQGIRDGFRCSVKVTQATMWKVFLGEILVHFGNTS